MWNPSDRHGHGGGSSEEEEARRLLAYAAAYPGGAASATEQQLRLAALGYATDHPDYHGDYGYGHHPHHPSMHHPAASSSRHLPPPPHAHHHHPAAAAAAAAAHAHHSLQHAAVPPRYGDEGGWGAPAAPRGKPEAMAAKLASAARIQQKMDELEDEVEDEKNQSRKRKQPPHSEFEQSAYQGGIDASSPLASLVSAAEAAHRAQTPDNDEDDDDEDDEPLINMNLKSTAPARKKARKSSSKSPKSLDYVESLGSSTQAPKKTPKKRKTASSDSTGNSPGTTTSPKSAPKKKAPPPLGVLTMQDPVEPITDDEYSNLEKLFIQFCKVPLLAEFSRPVSLLHPELLATYSKIIDHPVDLGKVCRKVRRREYQSLREVRLDTWRIFANCVRFHSHSTNKQAVPSFVSIALHLREFFNALWQEYMIPSDVPSLKSSGDGAGHSAAAIAKQEAAMHRERMQRQEDRKNRLVVTGLTVMTMKCMERVARDLRRFLDQGGRVDALDSTPVFPSASLSSDDGQLSNHADLGVVVARLEQVLASIRSRIASGSENYGIDEFDQDLKSCYLREVLEDDPVTRNRISNRIDRFFGKIIVPIYEANSRGVSQSSIWGCMAASVWARESSKKPYWPAIVLGIMAPVDQQEDWHAALTKRNETRLPEKLRTQLAAGKRKAEQALRRQASGQMDPQSYFLVEFLGTHEFIWVREHDIVENFDPTEDPNQNVSLSSKKKRSSGRNNAHVIGSKVYDAAIEEGRWALDEFDMQLQDSCGDGADDDDADESNEELNYSYSVLCQSDDEADEVDRELSKKSMTLLDIEECNELLASDGLMDFSVEARKNAKKKVQQAKKQKQDAEKKQKAKKTKTDQSKKLSKAQEKELLKEQKELEKRRKKRSRDRARALKASAKNRNVPEDDLQKGPSGRRNLIYDKKGRATCIVEGYLSRAAGKDYKSLAHGGVMSIAAANVDSSGLLGLALAFRAVAGEIAMPSEGGLDIPVDEWDAIDVDNLETEEERVEALKKQVSLLEERIKKVQQDTELRVEALNMNKTFLSQVDGSVVKEELVARQNPLKKKKKTTPEKGSPLGQSKGAETPESTQSSQAATQSDSAHQDLAASKQGNGLFGIQSPDSP